MSGSLVGMGRTAAGIIAPLSAIDQDARRRSSPAFDDDGRRRIVLTRDDRRQVDKVVALFRRTGQAFVLVCAERPRVNTETGQPAPEAFQHCGEIMKREADGTNDQGFGCKCSRIHFEPPPVPQRFR